MGPGRARRRRPVRHGPAAGLDRLVCAAPGPGGADRDRATGRDGSGDHAGTEGIAQEAAARKGDPPTERLNADWRKRLEDIVWAMLNAPEWAFSP